MKNKRGLIAKIAAVVFLLVIAAVMFIIGRGHTIYIDNKTVTAGEAEITALNRVVVIVNGEQIAKLAKRERGMVDCMGQRFGLDLEVTRNKGDEPEQIHIDLELPYNLDGIVINVPAYLAGQPQEVWMTEFVSLATTDDSAEDEEIITDEFELMGDI